MAFCLLNYLPHGGMQRDFLRIALCCQDLGFRIRIYALSWEGRIPDGMDVIIVPVHGLTNHRRYARYAAWVANALQEQPVVCSVGFHPMAGLDVCYAGDGCYAEKTPSGKPSWRNARHRYFADAERAVFARGARTKIMLIAENQRALFERHYGTGADRMVLLPPGITRDRMAPDNAEEVRAEHARRTRRGRRSVSAADDRLRVHRTTASIDRSSRWRSCRTTKRFRTKLIAIGHDDPRSFIRMAQRLRMSDRFSVLHGTRRHSAISASRGSAAASRVRRAGRQRAAGSDRCRAAVDFHRRMRACRIRGARRRRARDGEPVPAGRIQRYGRRGPGQRDTTRPMASKRHRVRSHRRSIQHARARGGAHCERCPNDVGAAQWPWRRSGR